MPDPVKKNEVQVGLVVTLDQAVLEQNEKVHSTSPSFQASELIPRPFLCVEVLSQGRSTWTPLTREPHTKGGGGGKQYKRLKIEMEWKVGTMSAWVDQDSYLQDGANLYQGVTTAILKAQADDSVRHDRCHVSEHGLEILTDAIMSRKRAQENSLLIGKFAK